MNITRNQTPRGRFWPDRNGAAAVEFALTAPILIMFLFAGLEFSRYNMIQQTANNAAFESTRQCILPGAAASDGQTAAQAILSAVGITGGVVTINPLTITNATISVTTTVAVPTTGNLWVTPIYTGTGTIKGTCTLTSDWVYSSR
jgi:Flp pilus assembly protein TadG